MAASVAVVLVVVEGLKIYRKHTKKRDHELKECELSTVKTIQFQRLHTVPNRTFVANRGIFSF